MSRTQQLESRSNPATKTLQFKSGILSYYDKEAKENIEISYPFSFFMLNDDYFSYNGYNKDEETGVYSNEVSFFKTPNATLSVKLNGGTLLEEVTLKNYKEKKDESKRKLESTGAKYTQMVYGLAKFEDSSDYQIFRMMVSKSSLTGGITETKKIEDPGQESDGWIRFKQFNKKANKGNENFIYNYEIVISGIKAKKNKLGAYSIPVFEVGEEVEEGLGDILDNFSREIDSWFDYYNKKNNSVEEPKSKQKLATAGEEAEEDNEDLPF